MRYVKAVGRASKSLRIEIKKFPESLRTAKYDKNYPAYKTSKERPEEPKLWEIGIIRE